MKKADLAAFQRNLLEWYAVHGRHDLPWRNTADPYHIYLSEVMLQQTQVATVLQRYYHPFLERFPSLESLARAKLDDVLKRWEGLGYYRRAAHLHQTAKTASPQLPHSIDDLLQLPGIGRNTAHAIAAFAHRQPVPVMEANIRRVIHRIFALPQAAEAELWQRAEQLLSQHAPFDHNQAMMDLGALLCTPRAPRCSDCPAQDFCLGKQQPKMFPLAKKRPRVPERRKLIAVFRRKDGALWLEQRQGPFLQGLFGFPEYDPGAQCILWQHQRYGVKNARYLGKIRQAYSHFTLSAQVYLFATGKKAAGSGQWRRLEELVEVALSGADHKIAALLYNRHSEHSEESSSRFFSRAADSE